MKKTVDIEKNKHKYTGNRLKHIISSLPYAFFSLFVSVVIAEEISPI